LSEGWHSLKIKVWDIFNNSSEKTITFKVLPENEIRMSETYNYPNPATDHTSFIFEHNRPGENLKVTVTVFNMQGQVVALLNQTILTGGFSSTPIEWDLKDTHGNLLRQGIYPYRIRISNPEGYVTESYDKLVVIRQ
jgi:hypothetical protein